MTQLVRKKRLWLSVLLLFITTTAAMLLNDSRAELIYVYSDSCGYCATFTPTFERVAAEYPDVDVKRLNIVKKPDYTEAKQWGAEVTPTVFVVRGGDVVDKLEGDVPAKAFRRFLQKNLAGRDEE
ncbi:thioredoxin family protein [Brevibacillus sp. H7]|jgi:thioredoxin-like negative regulator of GroEL|uniref:thioredoxin family protein n=1 Tax=Brevibacillus sp. H7 TaxID=3349138 RepID=UPI00382E1287